MNADSVFPESIRKSVFREPEISLLHAHKILLLDPILNQYRPKANVYFISLRFILTLPPRQVWTSKVAFFFEEN